MPTPVEVLIRPAKGVELVGILQVPADAFGVAVFAHGSGSSRLSPRNQSVAQVLNDVGVATVLFDLLTDAESADRGNVFDVELLADRLIAAIDALADWPQVATLPVGLFGASTGAAAALLASIQRPQVVAVVSRGGRPDLAWADLPAVTAPTLLVVGGDDLEVLELNREAAARLNCPHELRVIPGASHLFEEAGTLQLAAEAAAGWFTQAFRR